MLNTEETCLLSVGEASFRRALPVPLSGRMPWQGWFTELGNPCKIGRWTCPT